LVLLNFIKHQIPLGKNMTGNAARVQAVQYITNRQPMSAKIPEPLSNLWASDVFTLAKMKESLPKEVFKSV